VARIGDALREACRQLSGDGGHGHHRHLALVVIRTPGAIQPGGTIRAGPDGSTAAPTLQCPR
jgi:hypothetical protein